MIDKEAAAREQPSKAIGVGNVVDVAVSTEDCQYKRKDSRVTWNDNHGKELAKIWEFELSDTSDSDDESGSNASPACTCVIQ